MLRSLAAVGCITLCLAGGIAPCYADEPQFGADYTQDFFRDVTGGVERGGGAPGIVNFNGAFDSGNDSFYVDFLGTFGSSISDRAGDIQGLSNIEAHNTFRLYEAWYQHSFGASGVMLRGGLQDYAVLFNNLEPAQLFVNSSFGTDATIAQVGPSIFPETTVGLVTRWQSQRGAYVMGGVYDGKPGAPGHPNGTHIELRSGDGVFAAFEAGIAGGDAQSYKAAIGGWYRTSRYTDPAGRARDRNGGVYAIGSLRVTADRALPAVDVFAQFGRARSDRNDLESYIGLGTTVTGLFPGRPDDALGFGIARAHASNVFRRVNIDAADAETAFELTYQFALESGLSIQPDVQYIVDPGALTHVDNAWAAGIRIAYAL
ncbi:MAG TPA: carbohydrate porin [Gammaproteobacteria bacterium]|nr:carbohydrate porin [Gammaproteobacteria bacterium]